MDIKTIFKDARAYLKSLPGINWVDLDKGQLEMYSTKPAVGFPCALFSVSITRAVNHNHKNQQCSVTLTVRIAFDYTGESNGEVDEDMLAASLEYFDICQSVYTGLQGKSNGQYSPFERTSQIDEAPRRDGLKVVRFTFSSSYMDNSANQP